MMGKVLSDKGKDFYMMNKGKQWDQIFMNIVKTNQQRKRIYDCLHAYQKLAIATKNQQTTHIYQFVNLYATLWKEMQRYEAKIIQNQDLQGIWAKARQVKEMKPKKRITLPEQRYKMRSVSNGNNSRPPKLFDCLKKLCPRFGRKRGSSKRYNPKKSESLRKSESTSKKKKNTQTSRKKADEKWFKPTRQGKQKFLKTNKDEINTIEDSENNRQNSEISNNEIIKYSNIEIDNEKIRSSTENQQQIQDQDCQLLQNQSPIN